MINRIHVNQHFIRANAKDGGNRPVYTSKCGGETRYAREIIILGPSKLVYNTDGLSCGAKCYLETTHQVQLIDEMSYEEAKQYGID